ncbi:unnamed protein product [Cyclocybe aegerita]|uniref:Uncharacterized protein n=1 Tax=Cyclocybe aegerita TaxID=1973307 RepID=A0A8S0WA52_CYCAE|nr:unnamed protein product [Cyclocybe aegerita]
MTEENPLVLTDDIADFRALCWALYATPVQLYTYQGERIRTLDLLQVVCLLEIAHKYHFTAYEHWARDILIRHTDPRNLHPQFRFSYPPSLLSRMLRLSEKCHSAKLRDNVEATWLLRFDSPGLALTTAEDLQLRQFQGKCYYKLVRNLGSIRLEGSSTAFVPYEMELSPEQRARLFQGAWSIQRFLRGLREDCRLPKKDAACDQARHDIACKRASQDFFGRGGDEEFLRSADPLEVIHNFLEQHARSQHQGTCVLKHLVTAYHDFGDSLADHFLGSCGP